MTSALPLARALTCFSMFVYIRNRFRFPLTAQSAAQLATGECEAEFKFQRRSCKHVAQPERPKELARMLPVSLTE